MKYKFLNYEDLLTPLLDFDLRSENIDIHNDFECFEVKHLDDTIEFLFERTNASVNGEKHLSIIFEKIVESNLQELKLKQTIGLLSTLINFGRGGLTNESIYFNSPTLYFFLGFEDGELINIFCRDAIVILW